MLGDLKKNRNSNRHGRHTAPSDRKLPHVEASSDQAKLEDRGQSAAKSTSGHNSVAISVPEVGLEGGGDTDAYVAAAQESARNTQRRRHHLRTSDDTPKGKTAKKRTRKDRGRLFGRSKDQQAKDKDAPKAKAASTAPSAKDVSASAKGTAKRQRAKQQKAGETLPPAREGTDATSLYRDVERYRRSGKERRRRNRVRIVLLTVLGTFVVSAIAIGVFLININSRLTSGVTDDLRDQLELSHSEPGDPFYLLLLGIDKDYTRWAGDDSANYGADEHAYRSDSIMLCRIDPRNVKVTMVSIHRDTLVDMGDYGRQKINASYAFGGAAYTTEIVSEFAGVPISHYAEVDLDRFTSIVDVVGGVTVNLPVPVYDPVYTKLDLPAGEQTLTGREAALLCRCRHGYDAYGDGDRFRAANQRMVFTEVIKKVLRSNPATMVATISTMADSVTTDMTLPAILDLAGQMQHLNVETDIMTGMEPTEGMLINGGWYEKCLTDRWQKMMMRVDQGLPPYDESEGEYDSTAGIAGGVGEEGQRAAEAAGTPEYERPNEEDFVTEV